MLIDFIMETKYYKIYVMKHLHV